MEDMHNTSVQLTALSFSPNYFQGGWVNFLFLDEYPVCPDCKVKVTDNFMGICGEDWLDDIEMQVFLCPQCGRPALVPAYH